MGLSVVASGLSLRTREGAVFQPIDLQIEPGQLVAICGPAGSGRSALAMVLAGRMKFRDGTLWIADQQLPKRARWVRKNSTVAPIGGVLGLEDGLRVHEEVNRARWLAGRKRLRPGYEDAAVMAGLTDRRKELVRELSATDRNRLAIASGFVENTGLLVVDDLGSGVAAAEHIPLWQMLREASNATGVTVVATTLEDVPPQGIADKIIEMPLKPAPEPDSLVLKV